MAENKLTLNLDIRSGLPIYTQIVNQIQSQLVNGIIKPGDQLPTVRALAQDLRVNFNTVATSQKYLRQKSAKDCGENRLRRLLRDSSTKLFGWDSQSVKSAEL
ncbi:MAG: GntR family transcriptional regulator [Chloroflexi bacterium]|nr:GntR family transcriptional regulator [Chloroflexota bacterium]